jgi:hypothetical protein
MKFRYVPAPATANGRILADTLLGRFIVSGSFERNWTLCYHPKGPAPEWVAVRLEPIGEYGPVGPIVLDTVQPTPGQPAVLRVTTTGYQGFWGGSFANRVVSLIDITREPLLLLKAEVLNEKSGYGRLDETEYDEDAATSEAQEQQISVQNRLIVIGRPRLRTRNGQQGEAKHPLATTPETMLRAGRYRYQDGRVFQVSN